jgi:hypothetical protein
MKRRLFLGCATSLAVASSLYVAALRGGFWKDDGGVGQRFPVGCTVELTYCNTFYEGTPQTCNCLDRQDAGAAWGCGI